MLTDFAHVSARFGLGRAPGDAPPRDLRAALTAELDAADPGPAGASVADAFTALREDRTDRQAQAGGKQFQRARELFQAETAALQDWAIGTKTPFRERLVWFWANHFTVSVRA